MLGSDADMNKLRISLTERAGEIKGVVSREGDGLFALEALAVAVEHLARSAGVTPAEYVRDLYTVVTGKVTGTQN